MTRKNLLNWILPAAAITLVCVYYFSTASLVPFHPDEATYLYTSEDVIAWMSQWPADVSYTAAQVITPRTYYRLVDPPLAKIMIGIGLRLAGIAPPQSDWAWNADWETNRALGNLPTPPVLMAGRWSIMIWFPFTLLLIFLSAKTIRGTAAGILAVLFFGLNALVLLHTRRAMSEGLLLFLNAAVLFFVLRFPEKYLLTAAAAGLAINTKVNGISSAALALFTALTLKQKTIKFSGLSSALITIIVIGLITFGLNPVHWKDPMTSVQAAVSARKSLMEDQRAALVSSNPEKVLSSLLMRTASLAGNQFFQPPALSDISNYDIALMDTFNDYRSQWINQFSQGATAGPLRILGATLGLVVCLREAIKNRSRVCFTLIAGWIFTLLAALFGSPLPYQRYALPLVLYETIFSAIGLVWLLSPIIKKAGASFRSGRQAKG